MNDTNQTQPEDSEETMSEFQIFLHNALKVGWFMLVLSMVFLYLSSGVISDDGGESVMPAIYLMISRTCGIAAFIVGAFAVFNRCWLTGLSLFFLSIALPLAAFHLHGTI